MRSLILLTAVFSSEPGWVEEIKFPPPSVAPSVAANPGVSADRHETIPAATDAVEVEGAEKSSDGLRFRRSAVPATPIGIGQDHSLTTAVRHAVATEPVSVGATSRELSHHLLAAFYSPRTAANGISGRQVSLHDLLPAISSSRDRLKMINAYWALATRVARHHASLESVMELKQVGPVAAADEPVLFATLQAARNDLQKHRIDTLRSQYRLVGRAGLAQELSSRDELPLPGDLPLIAVYPMQAILTDEGLPQPAQQQVQRLLDRQLRVEEQAMLLANARARFARSVERYQAARADIDIVIEAHQQLHLRRESCLAAVLRYNCDIGKVAVVAAGQGATSETLAAMLLPGDGAGSHPDAGTTETRTVSLDEPVEDVPANRLRPLDERNAVPLLPIPAPAE